MNSTMRLTLTLAAALGCATASAQSSVTLYGLLDVGVGSFKGSNTGVKATDVRIKAQTSGNMTQSRWGLGGKEDLGGGVEAFFDLSGYIRVDTGASGRADITRTCLPWTSSWLTCR